MDMLLPQDVDADTVRKLIYNRFDISLGADLGEIKGACGALATWGLL